MPLLYEDMGQRATVDQSILILQGRNVGGSTVHNLCYCFRTPEPILEMWKQRGRRARHARRRPAALLRARRADAEGEADQARRGEHPQQQDPRRLREARLQRLRHQPQSRELHASPASACSAARSTPSRACSSPTCRRRSQAGARIYANCPVRRIVAEAGRVRRVEGEVVDALGRPRHRFTVDGRRSSCCAPGRSTRRRCCSPAASPTATSRSAATCTCTRSVLLSGIYDEDIYGYRGIPAELLRRRVHRPRARSATAATS